MEILNYIIGLAIVVILISYFPKFTLFIVGSVVLLIFVRLMADLFWWGRDKGKW